MTRSTPEGKAGLRRQATAVLLLLAIGCAAAGCGGDERAEPAPRAPLARQTLPRPEPPPADSLLVAAADSAAAVLGAPPAEAVAPEAVREPAARPTPPSRPQPVAAEPIPFAAGTRDLGPYCLQVGAFRNPAYAEERYDRLAARGLPAVIETATVRGVLYHRVCVPHLPDRSAARRLGDTLAAEYGFPYLIRAE